MNLQTERLILRLPTEADRARFVELFCEETFMVFFSGGPDSLGSASKRFDALLERAEELPFAKQPVIDRFSGVILGYVGADWCNVDGERQLEFGYRLDRDARGRGYATEASTALLDAASASFQGDLLAIVHHANDVSIRTANKLGFVDWRDAFVGGELRYVSRRRLG